MQHLAHYTGAIVTILNLDAITNTYSERLTNKSFGNICHSNRSKKKKNPHKADGTRLIFRLASPEVVNGERIDLRPPPQEPIDLHAITNIAIDASI